MNGRDDAMYYFFTIDLFAPTASFRIPETHTFQQSLPLPPVTALSGLVGAAMGVNYESALNYRKEMNILFGVWGRHSGVTNDLWKYRKIKSGEVISAVLTREILADLELFIVICLRDKGEAEKVRGAFLDPVYALTAGTSDDLVIVKQVGEVKDMKPSPLTTVENTVLPGDHSKNYVSDIKLNSIPLNRNVFSPQVYLLPTAFTFNGEERRVSCREHFTFIDTAVTLKESVYGVIAEGRALPLL